MSLSKGKFFATIIFAFLVLISTQQCFARQYKSRVFNDSEQDLSASEVKNIAALEEAFASYQDDYQIASTGQYLAREMVANGEYEKAANYYYAALKSGGKKPSSENPNIDATSTLAEPVVKQLRLELAQVLLTLKRDNEVLALFDIKALSKSTILDKSEVLGEILPPDFDERILISRAFLSLQQFHQVVAQLQPLTKELATLTSKQLQQLSGLLYGADALTLVVEVLIEIRKRDSADVTTARQLTGLYIRLEQYQQALDLWSLAYAQGLLSQDKNTSPQDFLLLTDLYHRQKAPEKAARLLQQAMYDGTIAPNADNSYRLFEFWYQAKEISKAKAALWQSIQQSQNLQHALMLAELLQQAQDWQQLESLILLGCSTVLPDKFVGRINLFYGIALHKLGKDNDARRAFINASLVSGVKTQARDWLAFTNAEPASIQESGELWGPCLPEDPEIELPKNLQAILKSSSKQEPMLDSTEQQPQATSQQSSIVKELAITELPAIRLYAGGLTTTPENLQRDIKTKTFTLLKNLMRSGGRVDGRMHLVFSLVYPIETQSDNTELTLSVGFPYSGLPKTRAGFKIIKHPKRKALVRHYQGPGTELDTQWQLLVQQALAQGLTPSGDAIMIFMSDTSGTDTLDVKFQLIVE